MRLRFYLASLFLFSFYFYGHAQNRRAGTWELSGTSTHFNYSGMGQRTGFGVSGDYYISDKISVRGGLVANASYLKFSPAPLFWASLLEKSSRSHHSSFGRTKNPLLTYMLCLTMSDGFAYNIRIRKDLYFSPYIAPLQAQFFGPHGKPINDGVLVSSIGAGFKGYINKHYVFYAGAEYSKSFLFKNSGYGYSINASIGYVFKKH